MITQFYLYTLADKARGGQGLTRGGGQDSALRCVGLHSRTPTPSFAQWPFPCRREQSTAHMSPLLTLGFPQLPGHDGSWEVKLSEFGFYLLLFSLRLSSVGAAPQARLGLCRQGERLGSDQGLTALVWCSPPAPSGGWGCQGKLVNTQHPVRHRSSCTGAPTGSGEFGDRKRESSGMFWFKGHGGALFTAAGGN